MEKEIIKYLKFCKSKNLNNKTIRLYKAILYTYLNSKSLENMLNIIKSKKPGTQYIYKAVLINFLEFIHDKEKANRAKLFKNETQGTIYRKVLSKEYIEYRLKENTTDDEKTKFIKNLFLFIFQTGIRADEINHIVENNGHIIIKGKGSKFREIIYKKETWAKIKPLLFKYKWMLSYPNLLRYIKIIFNDKEVGVHTLRRSFATHMLIAGANPKTVQMQMGHTDINTTYKYLNLSYKKNAEEYNKYM
ncbi:tyrosine-type recombinase/integrase [Mycoplasma seminis]|uniref:Site-specific integrase n=1 Tax=Mycoplasma seminis TaxID=512749 RepID=A0ABY9HAJ6_9MOLU|nr:site-specific integrase [Mycoplasma seminis]WLP85276.1 site-specific integrase [Mycoplasma seminis]